ncbi:penicillin acylase family protein [Saprospira sp. CCB-QB6]|uniref:penicillin acylase family protein n=1 Tax=Saprospira sp. CCB-QB6 TaxID=3023936 RepID=UPI00234BF07B|nr:penicillin acylase family protein [Saprospira sp. CCB-QB6]WCL80298.1 penicillin acylase family protein [Saprospira sp. CCB-QB6]
MRILSFVAVLVLTIFLFLFLNSSDFASSLVGRITKKETFIPPMGKLLSPSSGFWRNAEHANGPSLPSSLRDGSLSAPVELLYDERMVPHIFADNMQDAFFAQGYATASLRLWQMEFQTHAVSGRLAEVLATSEKMREVLLKMDRKKRKSGLPLAAKKTVELWKKDPKTYEILQRYADGVNAYIDDLSYADLPLEYKLLNYRPEKWTVLKSALLLKAMAEDLTDKDYDFEMTNAYKYFGRDTFNIFYPEYFPEQSPIINDTAFYNFKPVAVGDSLAKPFLGFDQGLPKNPNPKPKGIGSNNWAVGGKKTASGYPILCNDPHLKLNLPSIWFEVQIVTPDFNVYGATLPGAPGVISGFNQHIAWGVTNVAHDVRDWYAVEWTDASKSAYIFDGEERASEKILDTVYVRGAGFVVDTLIYTHFGPVVRTVNGQDYVLHWQANEPSSEAKTFVLLAQAKNYQDYQAAIKHFSCPAQNLVFACNNGDIALWTQGKLPLRRPDQGKFVADGRYSFNQWSGFMPQEHIPHEYNPKKGYVASANQHSVSPAYPYYTYGYFEEYRGRYLNGQLDALSAATDSEMKALQLSNFSQKAQDFLPLLMKFLQRGDLTKDELELLALFRDWDYEYHPDAVAPTIFEDWFYNLQAFTYDELDEAAAQGMELHYPDAWRLLGLLKRDTTSFIWDQVGTKKRETVEDIVTLSFKETLNTLPKNKAGKPISWGEMKATALYHLARIEEFSVLNLPVGGTADALNAVSNRYDFAASRKADSLIHKGGSAAGPSWRMIVELGDKKPKAQAIYPGGQSGNPGSHYYDNMVQDWAEGRYNKLHYLESAEEGKENIRIRQRLH